MLPLAGLGTCNLEESALLRALENGCRLVDTAKAYAKDKLLATLEAEGDGKCFVFRDTEKKPFAIALWSFQRAGNAYFYVFDDQIQNWEFIFINRHKLKKKKIANVLLIWALLKHSQKHLIGPETLKYVDWPPHDK